MEAQSPAEPPKKEGSKILNEKRNSHCTQIVYTLAPKYLNRDYFKAESMYCFDTWTLRVIVKGITRTWYMPAAPKRHAGPIACASGPSSQGSLSPESPIPLH